MIKVTAFWEMTPCNLFFVFCFFLGFFVCVFWFLFCFLILSFLFFYFLFIYLFFFLIALCGELALEEALDLS